MPPVRPKMVVEVSAALTTRTLAGSAKAMGPTRRKSNMVGCWMFALPFSDTNAIFMPAGFVPPKGMTVSERGVKACQTRFGEKR